MIVKRLFAIMCFVVFGKVASDNNNNIRCDYYAGYPVTKARMSFYTKYGIKDTCTTSIKPCDPNEGRRVDGSCNNMKRACRGTHFTPMPRMLPASFSNDYHSRKSAKGNALRLPREIRTYLKGEATTVHSHLTTAVTSYAISLFLDVGSIHDVVNFLVIRPYTCEAAKKKDYWSTPIWVPADDPVHRFSEIRCMNMTRPMYYQSYNCTKDKVPSPIFTATSSFDLSHIYNYHNTGSDEIRTFKDGLLVTEEENGRLWPPNGPKGYCPTNEEGETRCFGYQLNAFPGISIFNVLFYLNHNYFAEKLAEINPCWSDEKIFQTAKEVNIAMSLQIYLYELMSTLLGHKDLVEAGILSEDEGCRADLYDNTLFPTVSLEYSYILRWFHQIQQGIIKLYDKKGKVFDKKSSTALFFRTGFMVSGDNMAGMVASLFRQPASDSNTIDPEIAERGLGLTQKASDITSNDLYKSRLFGFPPYIDYLYHCFGVKVSSFEDLEEFIPIEKITLLKDVYDDPRDIDLWSGVSSEKFVEGGFVPRTFACIVKKFLYNAIRSDRFYYERCDGPSGFTSDQLKEIRKSTIAMFLCNVGDGVTEIQPNAFRLISVGNELVPCSEIPNIDLNAWKDSTCAETK